MGEDVLQHKTSLFYISCVLGVRVLVSCGNVFLFFPDFYMDRTKCTYGIEGATLQGKGESHKKLIYHQRNSPTFLPSPQISIRAINRMNARKGTKGEKRQKKRKKRKKEKYQPQQHESQWRENCFVTLNFGFVKNSQYDTSDMKKKCQTLEEIVSKVSGNIVIKKVLLYKHCSFFGCVNIDFLNFGFQY